jgi:hypothetical protein
MSDRAPPDILLPIATHSFQIEEYVSWLSNELRHMQFGEIGLTFVIYDGEIKRVREIRETTSQPRRRAREHNR